MKTLLGALVLVLAMQGASLAQTPAASPNAMGTGAMQGGGAVPLVPVGKKGPAGSAVLSQQGGNLIVTLHLPPGYQPSGKAAIYSGSCTSSGKAAMTGGKSYPLSLSSSSSGSTNSGSNTSATNTGSENAVATTVPNLSIETLTSSPHVIVVQGTPPLCGDITNLLPPQKP